MVINNKQFQQGLLNLVKRLNSFNLDGLFIIVLIFTLMLG